MTKLCVCECNTKLRHIFMKVDTTEGINNIPFYNLCNGYEKYCLPNHYVTNTCRRHSVSYYKVPGDDNSTYCAQTNIVKCRLVPHHSLWAPLIKPSSSARSVLLQRGCVSEGQEECCNHSMCHWAIDKELTSEGFWCL